MRPPYHRTGSARRVTAQGLVMDYGAQSRTDTSKQGLR